MSEGVVQLFLRCNFPFMFWYWCFWSKYWCSSVPFLWIGKVFDTVQISIPSNIKCLIQKKIAHLIIFRHFFLSLPPPFSHSFSLSFVIYTNNTTPQIVFPNISHTHKNCDSIKFNQFQQYGWDVQLCICALIWFFFSFHFFSFFLFFFHKSNK